MADSRRSQLIPAGLIFILLAALGGPIDKNASGFVDGDRVSDPAVHPLIAALTYLLLVVGVGCLLVGWWRHPRSKAGAEPPRPEGEL
jgi:hypothetical protein